MENEITAFVIDSRERGKESRLLDLFSYEGLSQVLVGSSKLTGPERYKWSELIQPLHVVQLVLQKKGSWVLAQEGHVVSRFDGLRSNYDAFYAAQLMRLAIKKVAKPGLAAMLLYEALIAHLQALDQQFPARRVLASFYAKTLWVEGYIDQEKLPHCSVCEASSVPLWNDAGMWACFHHKVKGDPWSVAQLQMLFDLVRSKKIPKSPETEERGVSELLKSWIDKI